MSFWTEVVQYTSNDFEKLELKHFYSKKEYSYDNASMEVFNTIFKKEDKNYRVIYEIKIQ